LKDRAYLTGLILIAITFIACIISFYLLIYGIFILGIGILFLWVSKKPVKTKLFATILPIILYLPATYLFLLAYNYTSPKTFLIPSDYEGTIRIVYEEKCGLTLTKENGRQILQFPQNGILILNEKFDGGINNEYYLVDNNGKRTKITESSDFKDKTKKLPLIQVGGAGTLGGNEHEKGIIFSDFYLYNKDTTSTDDYKLSQRFDSLTNVVVNSCRTKK
jgi:hypothetical protein